jgi:hypothetical protein
MDHNFPDDRHSAPHCSVRRCAMRVRNPSSMSTFAHLVRGLLGVPSASLDRPKPNPKFHRLLLFLVWPGRSCVLHSPGTATQKRDSDSPRGPTGKDPVGPSLHPCSESDAVSLLPAAATASPSATPVDSGPLWLSVSARLGGASDRIVPGPKVMTTDGNPHQHER